MICFVCFFFFPFLLFHSMFQYIEDKSNGIEFNAKEELLRKYLMAVEETALNLHKSLSEMWAKRKYYLFCWIFYELAALWDTFFVCYRHHFFLFIFVIIWPSFTVNMILSLYDSILGFIAQFYCQMRSDAMRIDFSIAYPQKSFHYVCHFYCIIPSSHSILIKIHPKSHLLYRLHFTT